MSITIDLRNFLVEIEQTFDDSKLLLDDSHRFAATSR